MVHNSLTKIPSAVTVAMKLVFDLLFKTEKLIWKGELLGLFNFHIKIRLNTSSEGLSYQKEVIEHPNEVYG